MVLNPVALFQLEPGSTVYVPEDLTTEHTATCVSAKEFTKQKQESVPDEYSIDSDVFVVHIGDTEVLIPTDAVEEIIDLTEEK